MTYIETPEEINERWRQWEDDHASERFCDIAEPTSMILEVLDIDPDGIRFPPNQRDRFDSSNVRLIETKGRLLQLCLDDPEINGMDTFLLSPADVLGYPQAPPVIDYRRPGRYEWTGTLGVARTKDGHLDTDRIGEVFDPGYVFRIVDTTSLKFQPIERNGHEQDHDQ